MRLRSITISNFRSVLGSVTIPMDASIVLIHGPNGAGKTTILSAIEMAMTGSVDALALQDAGYIRHLVNMEAEEASIILSAESDDEQGTRTGTVVVRGDGVSINKPVLNSDESRTFKERNYLAQSELSKLFEIYKGDQSGLSPLIEFVNGLLGLGVLDALIDGLDVVDDFRNMKREIPGLKDFESFLEGLQAQTSQLARQMAAWRADLSRRMQDASPAGGAATALHLHSESLEEQIVRFRAVLAAGASEELGAAQSNLESALRAIRAGVQQLDSLGQDVDIVAARGSHVQADAERQSWWQLTGDPLEQLISNLRVLFSDLPSVSSVGPSVALRTARRLVAAEASRCRSIIDGQVALTEGLRQHSQNEVAVEIRLEEISRQVDAIVLDADDLVQALTGVVPHIESDVCPVCERNFAEVSDIGLVAQVSQRLSEYAQRAERLRALSVTRRAAVQELGNIRRDAVSMRDGLVGASEIDELGRRAATLDSSLIQLDSLAVAINEGEAILARAGEADGILATAERRATVATEIEKFLEETAREWSVALPHPIESLQAFGLGLSEVLTDRLEQSRVHESAQASIRESLSEIDRLGELLLSGQIESLQLSERLVRAQDGHERIRAIQSASNAVIAAANQTRVDIVDRVFNQTLNLTWQDLFARLAPQEPFLPALGAPDSNGGIISMHVETVYRNGLRAGPPGAMLSAGNLNTAALTLFLALHLSAQGAIPLLILDDPVQSMDEMHIAQFAALLRSLSRDLGRQVVIAVHERSLFEYLALELSPASDGDRLQLVELGRSVEGHTEVIPETRSWHVDPLDISPKSTESTRARI